MIHQPTERYKWFQSKIGSILYRNSNGCTCKICGHVRDNGLLVADQQHASYLYDNECEYSAEGTPLRYFDTKEQVDEWLKTLTPNL